jgi:hypothetical protein
MNPIGQEASMFFNQLPRGEIGASLMACLLLPLFGVGAVIALPIIYGLIGFLSGLLMAGLYNLVTGLIGGLEIELEQ